MKGRDALRRRRARRATGGFTLLELMVVVLLIAILAVLAAPSFSVARNDRLAFDYARRFQGMIHDARARASGRGAAQLVLIDGGTQVQKRGYVRVYEALDNAAAPSIPSPVTSCKGNGQWAQALANTIVPGQNTARFVEGLDLNSGGVNNDMDVHTILAFGRTQNPFKANTQVIALCFTPGGTTYAAADATLANAITKMQAAPAFNDVAEIAVIRGTELAPVGLRRRVIVAGSTAPRLKSE